MQEEEEEEEEKYGKLVKCFIYYHKWQIEDCKL